MLKLALHTAKRQQNRSTVEPRFNEPLFNEVLDITNDILCPSQSYSKMHGIEPRYNEFFDIANILYFPVAHNTLCLPPKFCINRCF